MTQPFTSRESMLNLAVQVEKSAEGFYGALANKFQDNGITFKRLAEDERGHGVLYSKLLAKGTMGPSKEGREKARSYLEALDSLGILSSLTRLHQDVPSLKDLKSAVSLATEQEKNTLLVYQNLLLYLDDEEDRRVIHMITDVEYDHLIVLSKITL
jgi:rubrerythrin